MKSNFLDPLVVERNEAEDSWTVYEEFDYHSELLGITIHVPKGLQTDFASIPKIFWNVLPPAEGKYAKAAVVHDYLYRNRGQFKGPDGTGANVTRADCDNVLLEAMKVLRTRRGSGSLFIEPFDYSAAWRGQTNLKRRSFKRRVWMTLRFRSVISL